jgi:PTS system nitrogen regulatory IIA component
MIVTELLSPDHVVAGLHASSKAAVLEKLGRLAGSVLSLNGSAILAALLKREALGSTGLGDGIALPHARLDVVHRPFGLLGQLRKAIDFDAVDEQPVDLVFLLLLPTNPHGEQLNALACVARRLRDADAAAAMRGTRDAASLYAAMCGPELVSRA